MKKYYNIKFYNHRREMVSDCPDTEKLSDAKRIAIIGLKEDIKLFYAEITVQKRMSRPGNDIPPDNPIIRIEILEDGTISDMKII